MWVFPNIRGRFVTVELLVHVMEEWEDRKWVWFAVLLLGHLLYKGRVTAEKVAFKIFPVMRFLRDFVEMRLTSLCKKKQETFITDYAQLYAWMSVAFEDLVIMIEKTGSHNVSREDLENLILCNNCKIKCMRVLVFLLDVFDEGRSNQSRRIEVFNAMTCENAWKSQFRDVSQMMNVWNLVESQEGKDEYEERYDNDRVHDVLFRANAEYEGVNLMDLLGRHTRLVLLHWRGLKLLEYMENKSTKPSRKRKRDNSENEGNEDEEGNNGGDGLEQNQEGEDGKSEDVGCIGENEDSAGERDNDGNLETGSAVGESGDDDTCESGVGANIHGEYFDEEAARASLHVEVLDALNILELACKKHRKPFNQKIVLSGLIEKQSCE